MSGGRRVIFFTDEHLGRHADPRHGRTQIERAEHVARRGIRGDVALQKHVGEVLRDSGVRAAKAVAEPARLLKGDHACEAVVRRLLAALVPRFRRIGTVPGGRVDQRETIEHLRIEHRELQRDAAAHRGPADDRALPADGGQQIRQVRGKLRGRVRARRLRRCAVAAAVVGEHVGGRTKRGNDAVPDGPVQRERVDEHDFRCAGGPALMQRVLQFGTVAKRN